jgi:hypothetical protein
MKKFVLSLALVASISIVNAQIYLNELYVRPQSNENEYFELYNSNLTPMSAGCYSLVTYFNDGTNKGFYVVDLPDTMIAARGFLVGSSADPYINYQGGQAQADFSWNDPNNISRYVYTNGSLQLDNSGAPFNDIFLKSGANSSGGNGVYAVFLFNGSTLVDAFLGASNTTTVPSYITQLGTLTHTSANGCGSFSYNFSNINNEDQSKFANVNPAAGTDNGYYRQGNGPCPNNQNWTKSSSPSEHTPGMPNPSGSNGNGGATGQTLTVTATCTNATTLAYTITGGAGAMYPLTVTLYNDLNANGQLDAGDMQIGTSQTYTNNMGQATFTKPSGAEYFLLAVDAQGACNDKVVAVQCAAGIILPVNLKSFNARRSGNNVSLTWETATEINNTGFYVQRLVGNGTWQTLGFVPSQATGGNSNSILSYTFSDLNTTKGVTQYRLRQVDADGRFKYSEIRTVRSNDLTSKIILYPNPSNTGSVTVVFDDATTQRDIYLTDMSGRTLKQWKSVSNNNVQLDNLNPGVYTVRIVDIQAGTQTTEKVVINQR